MLAMVPSCQPLRVSYPVSDSMSCRRRAKENGSENRSDKPGGPVFHSATRGDISSHDQSERHLYFHFGRTSDRATNGSAGPNTALSAIRWTAELKTDWRAELALRPPVTATNLECKVSNLSTKFVKRINNAAAVKAKSWKEDFGKTQVVCSAVLSGGYKAHNLKNARTAAYSCFGLMTSRQ